MIKTVIFDLNKVIVTYDKSDNLYISHLGIGRESFWKNRGEDLEKYTLGKLSFEDFLRNQLSKSNLSQEKLFLAKKIHNNCLRIVKGIKPLLEKLSKKYNLILMAGEGKESFNLKLEKFDLKRYFSKTYATWMIGRNKTDANFYNLILKENNLSPKETIFIDDQERYLNTAKKLGINTIKFENSARLKSQLSQILPNL